MFENQSIQAVCLREGGLYVIQCLEVNIAAQGKSYEIAEWNLKRILQDYQMLAYEFGEDDLRRGMKRAPEHYWNRFNAAPGEPAVVHVDLPPPPTKAQEQLVADLNLELAHCE